MGIRSTGKRLDISAVLMPNRMCYVIDIYPFYSLKALLGVNKKRYSFIAKGTFDLEQTT